MNALIFIFTLIFGIIAFKIFHYFNKKSFTKQSNLIPNNVDIVGQAGIIFVIILNVFFFLIITTLLFQLTITMFQEQERFL
jgi:CDP-diglyceride synthetase